MNTAIELEQWLRKETNGRIQKAGSRRADVRTGQHCTNKDRIIAHVLAEQMLGRNLPKTSRAVEENNVCEVQVNHQLSADCR